MKLLLIELDKASGLVGILRWLLQLRTAAVNTSLVNSEGRLRLFGNMETAAGKINNLGENRAWLKLKLKPNAAQWLRRQLR